MTGTAHKIQGTRERIAVTRPQQFVGTISQMVAALTHCVTASRLQEIGSSIPKVVILTGDEDNLVDPSNSVYMSKCMPEAEFIQWEKTGHAIQMQWSDRFNELLEKTFKDGRRRLRGE